ADDRLGEQVVALALTAKPIVARRSNGQVDEPARAVDRERRPDVRMALVLPRVIFPGLVAGLAGPRHGVEAPEMLAGAGVEGLHVAGRIVMIDETVADRVADDDDVAPDDRRR